MTYDIADNLSIRVKSVQLDYKSGNWSVAFTRLAWGMEKEEFYMFDRNAVDGENGTPYRVCQALVSKLIDELTKSKQPTERIK